MELLPEFSVTLRRLKKGETAYPIDGPHYEYHGQRTNSAVNRLDPKR